MKSIQNILEGLLDDDFASKLDDKIIDGTITKLWNKFLALVLVANFRSDFITYQDIKSTIDEFATAAKIRPTKTWPLKSTWEATPHFIMTFKNIDLIAVFDGDLYIEYWYQSNWKPTAELYTRSEDREDLKRPKDIFRKYVGGQINIELYGDRGPGSFDIDMSQAIVYKLPANFKQPEERLSVYGARNTRLAELRQIIANG